MHLPVDELLSLARGAESSAADHAHLAACPACAAELSRLRGLKAGLAALPDIAPPEDGWTRILAAADAPPARVPRWPAALAASLAVASIAVFAALQVGGGSTPVASAPATATTTSDAGWELVQAENARLEALLAALPEDQHVRASTGTTVSALEDRLALVDDQLSAAAFEPLAPGEAESLWRMRLYLMNSLVQVRYGQITAGL